MRKIVNLILLLILLVSFLIILVTGIIKLPAVLQALGLGWHDPCVQIISKIHDWSGIVFGIFAIIHIVIYWKIFTAMFRKRH